MSEEKKQAEKKIKISSIVYSMLVLFFSYLLIIGVEIYFFSANNQLVKKTTALFPYPAAIIGGSDFVLVKDLNENLDSVKMFYEKQDFSDLGMRVDFNTIEGKKRLEIKKRKLLNKMIENEIIKIIANQKGINITRETVSQEVDRKIKEFGSQEDVQNNLKKLYGWSLSDFEEKIVWPEIYRDKLFEDFSKTDPGFKEAKNKIEKALEKLEDKKDFGEVAEEYSEGESSKNRGDLGWFSADQIISPVSEVAFSLKKGERSEIIESELGFHIIKIEDKKTEDGIEKVRVSQILAKNPDFSEWLIKQSKNIKICIPLGEFYWNSKNSSVEFENQDLKKFEDNLENNSPGDISVIF